MIQDQTYRSQLDRIRLLAGVAGIVGLLACIALALLFDPGRALQSYLFAFLFWFGIALGSLAITLLHQLVGGAWGFLIRRLQEAAAATLPLFALLFLPILIDVASQQLFGTDSHLYEWAHPEAVAADELLQRKESYLNVGFFVGRTVFYFVVWIAMAYFLNRWSLEQDRTADPNLSDRLRLLARAGLVAYVLTMTFAAFDWAMSIEPHWFSSIYGVLFIAGQGLSAMAFAIVCVALLTQRGPLRGQVSAHPINDLGNLTLAFIMFWTYVNLSQYLIIWSGNIPEEVTWYTRRTGTSWNWLILFVLAFQFVLPFLVLLSRRNKRAVERLSALALMILFVHMVEVFWLIIPAFHPEVSIALTDIAAPIGIGGIWVAALAWLLSRRALLPLHDPRAPVLQEAHHHG
jgi:hypothetical protein